MNSTKSKPLIVGLLFVILLFTYTIPPARADWVFVNTTYDGTFNVSPLSWQAFHANRTRGYKAVFEFEVTAGGNLDITFFICDAANYTLYTNGYSAYVFRLHQQAVNWQSEFEFPYDDTWYFVFDNTFSLITTKTVQFRNDLYRWEQPILPGMPFDLLTLALITILATIIIVAVIIVLVILIKHQQQRKQSPTTTPPPTPTTPQACPHCNTPLEGNETYCSNCGNKI